MRLATIRFDGAETAGIVTEKGILPIRTLNAQNGTAWKEDMFDLIRTGELRDLTAWYNRGGKAACEAAPGRVPSQFNNTSMGSFLSKRSCLTDRATHTPLRIAQSKRLDYSVSIAT